MLGGSVGAVGARVGLLSSVGPEVTLERVGRCEGPTAEGAEVRAFPSVAPNVLLEVAVLPSTVGAVRTKVPVGGRQQLPPLEVWVLTVLCCCCRAGRPRQGGECLSQLVCCC